LEELVVVAAPEASVAVGAAVEVAVMLAELEEDSTATKVEGSR